MWNIKTADMNQATSWIIHFGLQILKAAFSSKSASIFVMFIFPTLRKPCCREVTSHEPLDLGGLRDYVFFHESCWIQPAVWVGGLLPPPLLPILVNIWSSPTKCLRWENFRWPESYLESTCELHPRMSIVLTRKSSEILCSEVAQHLR